MERGGGLLRVVFSALTFASAISIKVTPCEFPCNGGRVALIIRGQSFRRGGRTLNPACSDTELAKTKQSQAMSNLKHNVVDILQEQMHGRVDIFMTDKDCHLRGELSTIFGSTNIKLNETIVSTRQSDGYRKTLDLFKQKACGGQPIESCYSYVIITRYDLDIATPFNDWGTEDYHKLNFASGCEGGCTGCCGCDCVNDALQMMPARLFPHYDAVVGKDCWNGHFGGHLCKIPVQKELEKIGAETGFAWNWKPKVSVREANQFGHIYLQVAELYTGDSVDSDDRFYGESTD
eukprot:TRINITY_DN38434_c0_g1_i1.p1 TRINITY_DN38434_c0_g1~~TRINITY_DN38434_c0_g1_i1.p1  ORF type:complete len:291 (-),score=44.70 TRINITY_DN38434_c0_g1_i1:74-946(-)